MVEVVVNVYEAGLAGHKRYMPSEPSSIGISLGIAHDKSMPEIFGLSELIYGIQSLFGSPRRGISAQLVPVLQTGV
jgi:hypothetical protein